MLNVCLFLISLYLIHCNLLKIRNLHIVCNAGKIKFQGMLSINLFEVESKVHIAKIIREKMEANGIKKIEIINGTNLSKTAVNRVLSANSPEKEYHFGTLLKVLDFMKIKIFVGKNEEVQTNVLSLF